jgi:hypothetical protein
MHILVNHLLEFLFCYVKIGTVWLISFVNGYPLSSRHWKSTNLEVNDEETMP